MIVSRRWAGPKFLRPKIWWALARIPLDEVLLKEDYYDLISDDNFTLEQCSEVFKTLAHKGIVVMSEVDEEHFIVYSKPFVKYYVEVKSLLEDRVVEMQSPEEQAIYKRGFSGLEISKLRKL